MASTDPRGLGRAFEGGRSAFVAYVMAGYPTRAASLEALRIVAASGADLIELGVPFADPLADGPVIREAAEVARESNEGGFGLAETIDLAAEFVGTWRDGGQAAQDAPPVALMTYLNPLMRAGLPAAAGRLREAGVGGVIIPDLPVEMARPWLAAAGDLDTVFLAAPTSTPERLGRIDELSGGFVYCVSTAGVTGERAELPAQLAEQVARVKAATTLPVAVGFGISTPEQATAVARIADGVVVGSAIVKRQADPAALTQYCSAIAEAVHGSDA